MHSALFLVALLIPVSASGQPPSSSLWLIAERLPTIFVLDDQGTEYRGKLLRVDADQLALLIDDKDRIFNRDTIRRVQKRGDSLRNGAAIGAIVAGAVGLLAGRMQGCPDCIGVALAQVGLFTAVGTGIDAAVAGRTLFYDRVSGTPDAIPGCPHRGPRRHFGLILARTPVAAGLRGRTTKLGTADINVQHTVSRERQPARRRNSLQEPPFTPMRLAADAQTTPGQPRSQARLPAAPPQTSSGRTMPRGRSQGSLAP